MGVVDIAGGGRLIRDLIFGEGLMGPTLEGKKLISIRKYRAEAHEFKKGELFRGVFKDGLSIILRATADTLKKPFSQLTDEEAQEDGYKNATDAFERLKHDFYQGNLKPEDIAALIRFEIPKFHCVPYVSLNEHVHEKE